MDHFCRKFLNFILVKVCVFLHFLKKNHLEVIFFLRFFKNFDFLFLGSTFLSANPSLFPVSFIIYTFISLTTTNFVKNLLLMLQNTQLHVSILIYYCYQIFLFSPSFTLISLHSKNVTNPLPFSWLSFHLTLFSVYGYLYFTPITF